MVLRKSLHTLRGERDNTSTIFRRFDDLAARNLLYLQSQLQELEAAQDEHDQEVLLNGDLDDKRAATSWADLKELSSKRPRVKRAMEISDQVQKTLDAYCDYLLAIVRRH